MKTILIVDDDESYLELLSLLLTKEGYRVLTAVDGPQGVAVYQEHHPDLVFLDLSLPSMNGIQVLREIRHIDSKAKIIVITGFGSVESAVTAMQSGAVDFVEKVDSSENVDFVEKVDFVTNFQEVTSKKIKNVLDEFGGD